MGLVTRHKSLTLPILLVLGSILVGCATTHQGYYDVQLVTVDSSVEDGDIEETDARVGPGEVSTYTYEDTNVRVAWRILVEYENYMDYTGGFYQNTGFGFELYNKTEDRIRIIWDEAVFVDHNSRSSSVIHGGIRYLDKENSQTPTVVIEGAAVEDLIVPTDNLYYDSEWRERPLFANRAGSQAELDGLMSQYIGETVKVYLPLEIRGEVVEYTFEFLVTDFIQVMWNSWTGSLKSVE